MTGQQTAALEACARPASRARSLRALVTAPRPRAAAGAAGGKHGRSGLGRRPHGVRRYVRRAGDRSRRRRSGRGPVERLQRTRASGSTSCAYRSRILRRTGSSSTSSRRAERARLAARPSRSSSARRAEHGAGSVTSSSRDGTRNSAGGRPPLGPSRRSPVCSSTPRRSSTRCRFVAETSYPSAAAIGRAARRAVNEVGREAKPAFVYDSFARSRSRASSAISP